MAVDARIKWTTVRSFGDIKYFNISYGVLFLVPILHELHEKAAPAMEWLGSPAPFPVTLRWIYAVSFFYAIAIAIYQLRCPKEIKRFGQPDEYISAEYDLFLRAHPHHRLAIVLARLDPTIDEEVLKKLHALMKNAEELVGVDQIQAQNDLEKLVLSLHPDAVQRYLEQDYEKKNASRGTARWASFLLYVVGTLIVLTLLLARSYGVIVGIQELNMVIYDNGGLVRYCQHGCVLV